jgi:hypothetical protein
MITFAFILLGVKFSAWLLVEVLEPWLAQRIINTELRQRGLHGLD